MQLKEIKKLKSGKYKIKIDDKTITTYDDVILKNKLLNQKEINTDAYEQLEIDNRYYDAYYKTVNHIMRKLRSNMEIRLYLENLEVPDDCTEKIISKLKDIGLINDEAYTRAYISDSFYLSNDGPDKIRNYLLSQEIDENVIEEEIDKIDRSELEAKLEKLISKKLNKDKKRSAYQLRQKLLVDMTNLGYSKDMIISILENCDLSDDDKMQKEYDKLYQKYSKKLSSNELYKKIKEKLYGKGFDINEIQSYINKITGN